MTPEAAKEAQGQGGELVGRPARVLAAFCLIAAWVGLSAIPASAQSGWRGPAYKATLKNKSIEAAIQSGQLTRSRTSELRGNVVGQPKRYPIDTTALRLHRRRSGHLHCETGLISQGGQDYHYLPGWRCLVTGVAYRAGNGDLILNSSVTAPKPIDEMRVVLFGAGLDNRRLVWVDNFGGSHVVSALARQHCRQSRERWLAAELRPTSGRAVGGEEVRLVVEGRDPRAGPSCVMFQGWATGQHGPGQEVSHTNESGEDV